MIIINRYYLIVSALIFASVNGKKAEKSYTEIHNCDISQTLKEEIASYESVVTDIIDFVRSGPFKGKTYKELEKFVDEFGPRISGSEVLEKSIDYMVNITKESDIKDVVTEEVEVPHWIRGLESVTLLEPRVKNIAVLGLGYSVSTPPDGITAEVVVAKDFDEFDSIDGEKIKGKIVVFDEVYTTYGETVKYRSNAAWKAAAKGAVACLIKSITPFSINTPHTGMMHYKSNITKIPSAAITLEDADFLKRLYENGKKIVIKIKLFSDYNKKKSRNILIDIKGVLSPKKLVILSGHIDSWDVGVGAMDDGGGMMISWAAPVILKYLKLKPKRTVRSILWTGEELGLVGAIAYEEKHRNESSEINIIMESDEGTFAPLGLSMSGCQESRCIVAEVLKLFTAINATTLKEDDRPGSDITVFPKDIPSASLLNDNDRYFWFHHTEGDTMAVENPNDLDLCTAFWTSVAYVIADLSADIPRCK